MTKLKRPDAAELDELCKAAGAGVRRVLVAGDVVTWPEEQDGQAGRALTGAAYCEVAASLETAHFARYGGLMLEVAEL
jgi:hypothetical protein